MKNIFTISLVFAVFATSALAAEWRADPWSELDNIFGAQELCLAFQNDESLLYERKSCFVNCETWTYKLHITCGPATTATNNNNDDTAQLDFIRTHDGKRFSSEKITAATWAKNHHNPLRIKAAAVESFGKMFILESLTHENPDIAIARYTIQSKRVNGDVAIVGQGEWQILTAPGSAFKKIIYKEHTTFALGKEIVSDKLVPGSFLSQPASRRE